MANPRSNPYVGPRFFEERDQRYFFGRQEESRQLTSLIIAHRVALFYAQSGAGKTSLLRAGIVPSLEAKKKVVVLPIGRVGGDLPPELSGRSVPNIFVFNLLLNLVGASASPLALQTQTLAEGLSATLAPAPDAKPAPTLLIIDQFEELFSSHLDRTAERSDFFNQLQELLATVPQLSLLLSMREDYIAQLDFFASQLPDRLRTRYRMERLPVSGALEAVREPAALAGKPYEQGVAEALVDNLRRINVGPASEERSGTRMALGDYVEPVHLQIVCRQLWERLPQDASTIRSQDVQEFGDVDEALAGFYEGALQNVLKSTSVREREVRNWFTSHLITPAETRGLVYQGPLETQGLENAAVGILNDAYIVRAEIRGGETWYELAHDRLIGPILQANKRWQNTHANPVSSAYIQWRDAGQSSELLLEDDALEQARRFAETFPADLSTDEEAFLERSMQAARRAAARRRNLLTSLAAVLLLLFAGLAAWGIYNANQAQANAEQASLNAEQVAIQADAARTAEALAQELAVEAELLAKQARNEANLAMTAEAKAWAAGRQALAERSAAINAEATAIAQQATAIAVAAAAATDVAIEHANVAKLESDLRALLTAQVIEDATVVTNIEGDLINAEATQTAEVQPSPTASVESGAICLVNVETVPLWRSPTSDDERSEQIGILEAGMPVVLLYGGDSDIFAGQWTWVQPLDSRELNGWIENAETVLDCLGVAAAAAIATPTPSSAPGEVAAALPAPSPDPYVLPAQWTDILGAAQGPKVVTSAAGESFENGQMFWIEVLDQIIIAGNDGQSWFTVEDTWSEAWDEILCEEARAIGYPVRGFGRIWCTDALVQSTLGAPTAAEINYADSRLQEFEQGSIVLWLGLDRTLAFIRNDSDVDTNGTWLEFR